MTAAKRSVTGLIGWPVAHSLSPAIHRHWLQHYQIEGSYELFATQAEHLPALLARMRQEGWRGINVTVPHKQAVLPLLNSVDVAAQEIGAVNTITLRDGTLIGSNTDAAGFLRSLLEGLGAEELGYHGQQVVILGAGGAARAIAVALKGAAAQAILLMNRSHEKASALAQALGVKAASWDSRHLENASLLVNATSLGMVHQPPLSLNLDRLPTSAAVIDIVYAPLETELLKQASRRGNVTIDGLGMLLHQAAGSFSLWHGITPVVDASVRRCALNAIAGRSAS